MEHKASYCVVTCSLQEQDLGNYISYGISATIHGEQCKTISDISVCQSTVLALAECFNRNELSILHFEDAVQDFLALL